MHDIPACVVWHRASVASTIKERGRVQPGPTGGGVGAEPGNAAWPGLCQQGVKHNRSAKQTLESGAFWVHLFSAEITQQRDV